MEISIKQPVLFITFQFVDNKYLTLPCNSRWFYRIISGFITAKPLNQQIAFLELVFLNLVLNKEKEQLIISFFASKALSLHQRLPKSPGNCTKVEQFPNEAIGKECETLLIAKLDLIILYHRLPITADNFIAKLDAGQVQVWL